jgi:NADH dehydrogenase (ubiquinone) 1 alpha subcomplex subunit 13
MQDLPPQQGYPSVRWTRNIPNKTIPSAVIVGGVTLMTVFGLFQLGSIWRERRELKREKLWARLYILPLLQAEWDREWVVWKRDQDEKEREIMKDVVGWKVGESCYKSGRFTPPKYDIDGRPVRNPTILHVDTGEPL